MNKHEAPTAAALPRVSVFAGDDSIGREKKKNEIIISICEHDHDVEELRYDSSVERFDEFAARAITPSLFQSVRIFHIRHVNQLSDGEREELARLMSYELPDVYLVVEFDENFVKKDRLKKQLAQLGVKTGRKNRSAHIALYDFTKPADYKIPQWLTQQIPQLFSRTISKNDAEYLVECVGSELDTLYSELQKLDIHLPAKAPIDRGAIESISGATRMQTPYELARSLGNRNYPQALEIIDSLFASTFYAPPCLAVIFRHFWGLFRIRAYAHANAPQVKRYLSGNLRYEDKNQLAWEIGVKSGLLRSDDAVGRAYPIIILARVIEQAQTFSDAQLKQIIEWLSKLDVDIKTGRAEADKQQMQLLCYKIVRIGKY